MKITILTMFPQLFEGFSSSPVLRRAQRNGELDLSIVDVKDYADGSFRKIDDSPYGGGPGMIMRVDTLHRALEASASTSSHVVLLSPKGRRYDQSKAVEFSSMADIVLVCGHYEGVDARFERYVDEQLSIGDFILTGGEPAAMVVVDSIARLLDGSLRDGAVEDESFGMGCGGSLGGGSCESGDGSLGGNSVGNGAVLLEYPQYTHPAMFNGDGVPPVLMSGDQRAISKWKMVQSIMETVRNRPDLLSKAIKTNTIGMSQASIYTYEMPNASDSMVLKVESASPCALREYEALKWLDGRLPVPKVLGHHVGPAHDGVGSASSGSGTSYILMSKVKGRMLCDVSILSNRRRLLKTAAAALEALWSVDTKGCPFCDRPSADRPFGGCPLCGCLERDLGLAASNVEKGIARLSADGGCECGYPSGVGTAKDLLAWLVDHRPALAEPDAVFSHGDLCLPNVFANCDGITGFIDLGLSGVADRWRDIAICLRSIRDNLVGRYASANAAALGKSGDPLPFGQFDDSEFFDVLGIEPDHEKLRYYTLLDELL